MGRTNANTTNQSGARNGSFDDGYVLGQLRLKYTATYDVMELTGDRMAGTTGESVD